MALDGMGCKPLDHSDCRLRLAFGLKVRLLKRGEKGECERGLFLCPRPTDSSSNQYTVEGGLAIHL